MVKLIHEEKESSGLQDFLGGKPGEEQVTSELALTEVLRVVRKVNHDAQRRLTVTRETFDAEIAAVHALLDRIMLITLDEEVLGRAGAFDGDPHLGSLDSIHLVSALELRTALTAFVTYDKALARAAEEAGLNVVRPR